jgi:hypothetical protein
VNQNILCCRWLTALQYIVQAKLPPEAEGEEYSNLPPAAESHDDNEQSSPRDSVAPPDTTVQETLAQSDNIYEEINFS